MSPEKWQQISALFKSALDQPIDARGLFLDRTCSDKSLRRQIEAMLNAHEQAGSFFDKPAVELPAQEELGKIIGSYRLIELLGAGGMGEVYLAEDTKLGRKVALKLLPVHIATQQEQVRRFQQEARVISALNHPNILTVYEFGYDDSRPFISAEYIEGETLRHRLSEPISIKEALTIVEQIANALIAAHSIGFIHRDIKPENVMLRREDGFVKVLDFGLAKLAEKDELANTTDPEAVTRVLINTTPGMVVGTISYMSPEQARGLAVDERADVWSLGVVLYELATGKQPFIGPTRADSLVAILEREPVFNEISIGLHNIITKALRKDKSERYQTVFEFLSDVQELKKGGGESFSITNKTTQSLHHVTEKTRTALYNKASFLAVCLLLIALTGISIAFMRRGKVLSLNPNMVVVTGIQKPYSQMSETEKKAFIKEQAFRISDLMGEHPNELSDNAVTTIKQHLDVYASRADNTSTKIFRENINAVYERAAQNAPVINRAFKTSSIPSIVGLYIAMIESEYNQCEESSFGARGAFQFLKVTAERYNVAWEDICNIEKVAPAAAKMIEDESADLGTDAKSMTLVLLSYNRGGQRVREDLRLLRSLGIKERSFWVMFENADKLDESFRQESRHYVPKFFASAIVGENPSVFGLKTTPLSQLL